MLRACFSTAALAIVCGFSRGAPPDHIVIVIEENHGLSQVIGYPGAPYLNQLAANGALFTDFYGLTHPSQPNYIHFFAGASLGVIDNSVPAGTPFTTPNLGASIIASGRTFASFSEDLPYAGFDGATFGAYARKHNPCANWQSASPGPNQLPLAANQPFSAFPSDFSKLPSVSLVVPNLNNDMHDGTIEQGDAWLAQHVGPYAQWAMNHNSLLIITWDEDANTLRNQIPTILYGPMVKPGVYASTYTLHNLLRTVCDLSGAAPPLNAQLVSPLAGVFASDPNIQSISIRRGTSGALVSDTYLDAAVPSGSRATISPILIDSSPSITQGLVRFDDFVGRGIGRVPPGAQVLSAKLKLLTGPATNDPTVNGILLYRMHRTWNENSTWNSLGAGVQFDGVEAAPSAEFAVLPNVLDAWAVFDVTSSVRDMVANPASNQGWVLAPTGGDGWRFLSSEAAVVSDRPTLEVTFVQPVCDGDLNGDSFVDDSDFSLFVQSYDALVVPPASAFADFNRDDAVDDADFVSFVVAYETLLCD
ncbi:MAG: DNRLRE domain-containing protein [Phycisphaeraceae bacterium]|nr:DNRLRE domain-containing protein [Phycisphaeraceae bacterium]